MTAAMGAVAAAILAAAAALLLFLHGRIPPNRRFTGLFARTAIPRGGPVPVQQKENQKNDQKHLYKQIAKEGA